MPRLNIYIPDDLDLALRNFPGEMNISKVCAAALRAQLAAKEDPRIASSMFFSFFDKPSWIEQIVLQRYRGLTWVSAPDITFEGEEEADVVAEVTSQFLDRTFFEGCVLGIGGGAHIWDIVRRLERRNLGMNLWAIGYGHVDREVPHLHPNSIVTLLSILYAPRSQPYLVGAQKLDRAWHLPTLFPNDQRSVKRYLIGSCSMFDPDSAYARLLGREMTDFLMEMNVMGDFLGVFIAPDGRLIEPYAPNMTVSHLPSTDLRELAKRDDTIVLLTASGRHKARLIRAVIEAGLCNSVITDLDTACSVVGLERQKDSDDIVEAAR